MATRTRARSFVGFVRHAALLGLALGAIVGFAELFVLSVLAGQGLPGSLLVGLIHGQLAGAAIGFAVGVLGGVVGAAVTITRFWPVTDPALYTRAMRRVGAISALIFGVGIPNVLFHRLIVGTKIFLVVVPAIASPIGGWYAAGRVARRHLADVSSADDAVLPSAGHRAEPMRSRGRGAAVMSLVLTVGGAVAALFLPLGSSISSSSTSGGPTTKMVVRHFNLYSSDKPAIIVCAIPIAIALMGVAAHSIRSRSAGALCVLAAILLSMFVVLGAFSVGVFFVPAAGSMIYAAVHRSGALPRKKSETPVQG